MDSAEALRRRAKEFALKVIQVADTLPAKRSSDVLGKQILRSATSVGANYRAACRSRSRAEFVSKLHTVQEEADETQYWLELLHESGSISDNVFAELHSEARELTAIFTASEKTARRNRGHQPAGGSNFSL